MSQPPQIELDTSLGYLLKQTASELRTAMEAVLRPLGMSITGYSCLELLSQRPHLSNSELARSAFVSRQSMNVLLIALQRDGLVHRPPVATAGRALPAELTPLGRSRVGVASAAVKKVESRMQSGLTGEEITQLGNLLRNCGSALRE
ncbi:MarR family winged helix-turn-helix transcriptional regulator [Microbacterium sp.]|uniref:MarR family winged helix-turn-helix transcriptional regulator n=1 Tax=Microbacterium sp. TaxID=51671 RepID=UPI0035641E42